MVMTKVRELYPANSLLLATHSTPRRVALEDTWTHISCCFLQQCAQSETQIHRLLPVLARTD